MNEVERYKNELADEMYCDDHYGESCDGNCKGCLEATRKAFTNFENLVRTDERRRVEEDFQNSDYWNDYLAKVIAEARADERTKTLDECKKIVDSVLKYYQNEYFRGDTFYGMRENILYQIEKLKNTRSDM